MRRYIISYDLYRPGNNYSDLTTEIKRLSDDWEHPLANLWIVDTDLSASEIRSALGDHMITGDKLYICEAGGDVAAMDIAPGTPCRMSAVSAYERAPVRLLASVLAKDGDGAARESRLLTAATEENWQSA